MASSKRLHAEVDKKLKTIDEGCEQFETTYNKVKNAKNQVIKEKAEENLKKEIKKLQRLREFVKIQLANPEIKEKDSLYDARRRIEDQMEKFKTWEKGSKTKAFSKEGLALGVNIDKRAEEKIETRKWISSCIQELEDNKNEYESDIERLRSKRKGNRKLDQKKQQELQKLVVEINEYITKIEFLLRAMENDIASISQINDLKDTIEEFCGDFCNSTVAKGMFQDEYSELEIEIQDAAPSLTVTALGGSMLLEEEETAVPEGIVGTQTVTSTNGGNNIPTPNPGVVKPTRIYQKKAQIGIGVGNKYVAKTGSVQSPIQGNIEEGEGWGIEKSTKYRAGAGSALSHKKSGEEWEEEEKEGYNSIPNANTYGVGNIYGRNKLGNTHSSPVKIYKKIKKVENTSLITPIMETIKPVEEDLEVGYLNLDEDKYTHIVGELEGEVPGLVEGISRSLPLPTLDIITGDDTLFPALANSHISTGGDILLGVNAHNTMSAVSSTAGTMNQWGAINTNASTNTNTNTDTNINTNANTNINTNTNTTAITNPTPNPNTTTEEETVTGTVTGTTNQQFPMVDTGVGDATLPNRSDLPHAIITNIPIDPYNIKIAKRGNLTPTPYSHPNSIPPLNNINNTHCPHVNPHANDITAINLIDAIRRNQAASPQAIAALEMLELSYHNRPIKQDSMILSNAFPVELEAPTFGFPTLPLSLKPSDYSKLDVDTLFFIFYHQGNTEQQYYASKQLKQEHWRFHTKYFTWFRRLDQPTNITADLEEGSYTYFDYENEWRQRVTDNFCFEYKYLEKES